LRRAALLALAVLALLLTPSVAPAMAASLEEDRGEDAPPPPPFEFRADGEFGEAGTVVIDGDVSTNCRSFALMVQQWWYAFADDPEQRDSALRQCREAGLLPAGAPGAGADDGTDGGAATAPGDVLPDSGGPPLVPVSVAGAALLLAGGWLLLFRR